MSLCNFSFPQVVPGHTSLSNDPLTPYHTSNTGVWEDTSTLWLFKPALISAHLTSPGCFSTLQFFSASLYGFIFWCKKKSVILEGKPQSPSTVPLIWPTPQDTEMLLQFRGRGFRLAGAFQKCLEKTQSLSCNSFCNTKAFLAKMFLRYSCCFRKKSKLPNGQQVPLDLPSDNSSASSIKWAPFAFSIQMQSYSSVWDVSLPAHLFSATLAVLCMLKRFLTPLTLMP